MDSDCTTALSEKHSTNESMNTIHFVSSPLTGGLAEFCNALYSNTSLETLRMWNVTITDEDAAHLSLMLKKNVTLKELVFVGCDITDTGFQRITEGLIGNKTITHLDFSHNPQITSDSITALVELIKTTSSLKRLHLQNPSLKDNDMEKICEALTTNKTIQKVWLLKQHMQSCESYDSYDSVKDRLLFL